MDAGPACPSEYDALVVSRYTFAVGGWHHPGGRAHYGCSYGHTHTPPSPPCAWHAHLERVRRAALVVLGCVGFRVRVKEVVTPIDNSSTHFLLYYYVVVLTNKTRKG